MICYINNRLCYIMKVNKINYEMPLRVFDYSSDKDKYFIESY